MLIPQDFRGATAFDADGRFFTYTECTSPGTVAACRLWVEGQPVGLILPGQSFEVVEDCHRWELVPVDPACTGRVIIGHGRMHTGRIVGSTETVSSVQASVEGSEFSAGLQRTAAASLFAAVGITAITRPLALRRMQLVGNTSFVYRTLNQCSAPTQIQIGRGKGPGSPTSDALVQAFDAIAVAGAITGVTVGAQFAISQLSGMELIQHTPIILMPGDGIWSYCATAAAGLNIYFEWRQL